MFPKKEHENLKRAVIYCRVSTKEQVDEGNSLNTQEKNCREYALKTGYEIIDKFIEQGESAKTTDRPELQKMMGYCAQKKNNINAVIIYKLDRISRNTDDYSQIRILLKRYGVEIKSTTEYFENTPAGRFMENIIANVAQFDNDVRTERSVGGMRDATREGRYVWKAPVGYKNTKIAGKATITQNEFAPLVKKAFELVASNLTPIEEVRRTIIKEGLVSSNGKPLSTSHFFKVLQSELYKGDILKFGERHKGTFEPIISEELFEKVQWVLKHRTRRASLYKTENPDFTLRRFVYDEETRKKLTGCWAQGRRKKYPYYFFSGTSKNYRKEKVETLFKNFVNSFSMSERYFEEFKQKISENLVIEQQEQKKKITQLENSIQDLKEQQNKLLAKNLKGVINDRLLQEQLAIIDKNLMELQLALSETPQIHFPINQLVKFVSTYLKNPGDIWEIAEPQEKLLLQWFEFPKGVLFNGNKFRTDEICSLFKLKSAFSGHNYYNVPLDVTQQNILKLQKNQKLLQNKGLKEILYWNTVGKELGRLAEILRRIKNYPP